MIKTEFLKSLENYSTDSIQNFTMLERIEKEYTSSNRHYHTLNHLDNLLTELADNKEKFASWDVIVFAIAYHDVVYNTLKSNNEEKSAEFARKELTKISVPENLIIRCEQLILATKKHTYADFETNLFTDADLSILGATPEVYKLYSNQIRKEFSIYPDLVYNPGRRKVLKHFLDMKKIFKTNEFAIAYESKARINLQTELNSLL